MSSKTVATKQFQLEEKVYFKILIRTRLKDHWWFYVVLLLVVLWNLNDFGDKKYATLIVILGLIYPVLSFFYLYFWATSKKNRAVFLKRNLEFDESFMTINFNDGTENHIPFKRIVKSIETRTFFLLYIANAQFIYIPKNSFKSLEDMEIFSKRIQNALE